MSCDMNKFKPDNARSSCLGLIKLHRDKIKLKLFNF